MTYTIRKHIGLRTSMAHVYNGSYGTFGDLADAIAWANFKHDGMNNTFVCLDNGDVIYGIIPSGSDYWTDTLEQHKREYPYLEQDTKQYRIKRLSK